MEIVCETCKRRFLRKTPYENHLVDCKVEYARHIQFLDNVLLCDYGCGKIAKFQFKSKNRYCCSASTNNCEVINKKISNKIKGRVSPNKGKTKETHQSVASAAQKLKQLYAEGKLKGNQKRKGQTKETNESIRKMSETLKRKYKSGEIVVNHWTAVLPKDKVEEISNKISKNHIEGYASGKIKHWSKGKTNETDVRLKQRSDKIKEMYKTGELIAPPVWNKGLTKENNDIIKRVANEAKEEYSNGTRKKIFLGKTKNNNDGLAKISKKLKDGYATGRIIHSTESYIVTEDTINKRKKTIDEKFGGAIPGTGRGKSGSYKGVHCDSSWELAWVIYNLEHNIIFERNHKGFDYCYNNKVRKFYPDFILEDGTYIEIKGWLNEQFEAKISQFKEKLIIIGNVEIKPFLKYVIIKYGENFINLYEKKYYKTPLKNRLSYY